jgi:hypothetical protein
MAPSGCDRGCDRGWRLQAERAGQSGLVQRAVHLRVEGSSSRKPSVLLQAPFAMNECRRGEGDVDVTCGRE